MRALLRVLLGATAAVLVLGVLLVLTVWMRYGGGGHFEDRTGEPLLPADALELVADLDHPPGNIAVSPEGRILFTFHPEASPPVNVAEWKDGRAVPYPSADFQPGGGGQLTFQSVLSVRIDRQGRLWALDNAQHGLGTPRLLAFDLETGRLVHRHDFAGEIAGLGSHLNDFQVDPSGASIYIADASIFAKTPALVVYDVERGESRRVLEKHPSVVPEPYVPVVQGRRMLVFGIFAVRPGVDSIALDRRGDWLYYAPVTSNHLYRIRTRDLGDATLSDAELGERVESFAQKTMSDGITTDGEGTVYLTDADHSALVALRPDGRLETLLRDPRLRWPDGLSFGPGGWLYVTCSALHHVIGRSAAHTRSQAPFQIFRFRPGAEGVPGH